MPGTSNKPLHTVGFDIIPKKKKLLTGYSSLLEKKQKNPNIDLIKWKEIQTVSKLNNLSGIKILSEVSKVWRTQPA